MFVDDIFYIHTISISISKISGKKTPSTLWVIKCLPSNFHPNFCACHQLPHSKLVSSFLLKLLLHHKVDVRHSSHHEPLVHSHGHLHASWWWKAASCGSRESQSQIVNFFHWNRNKPEKNTGILDPQFGSNVKNSSIRTKEFQIHDSESISIYSPTFTQRKRNVSVLCIRVFFQIFHPKTVTSSTRQPTHQQKSTLLWTSGSDPDLRRS